MRLIVDKTLALMYAISAVGTAHAVELGHRV